MYKISVPIMNSNVKRGDRKRILEELRRFDAKRVFLSLDTYETETIKRSTAMEELRNNCMFFKENGFEVGAWLWTFWVKDNKIFRNMRSINGTEITRFMCPSDEKFVEFACGYIKDIANCGVDLIMFDDDFRYGFLSDGPACLCDRHICEINRLTGGKLTREEIKEYIINGKPNVYRNAYLSANGNAFKNFAKMIRKTVDSVDSRIRLGMCTCMSSWDIDGTTPGELAMILSGKTKSFIRLIGAPYWAVNKWWVDNLQDVVELERMESSWTDNGEIEIMAEGDVWPRPRTLCPASYLEGFDTAIRASGCTGGILKYGLDYFSNADYETGYARFHEHNREIYKKIDEMFGNKTHAGVRVYESMKKVGEMMMPTKVNKTVSIEHLFFSKTAQTLAYNTIPTVYEGKGICGAVFDENARALPLEALESGLILDIAAAEILTERGIDVGCKCIGESIEADEECFVHNNNHILINEGQIYNLIIDKNAEILSFAETAKGKIPVSYRYENKNGNRFLILNINTRSNKDNILKHYERSRQYAEQIKWLSGHKLPAYVYGNPSMYIQCKKSEDKMAVGLWNYFADSALSPVVELEKEYSKAEFLNCNGRLDGNKLYLTDIPAYGFAAFELS